MASLGSFLAVDARQSSRAYRSLIYDVARGIIVIVTTYALTFIQISRVYHYIRGEAFLKLYVLYNMLDVGAAAATAFQVPRKGSFMFCFCVVTDGGPVAVVHWARFTRWIVPLY